MSYNVVIVDATGYVIKAGYATLTAGVGETVRTDAPVPSYTLGNPYEPKVTKWDGNAWIEEAATIPAAAEFRSIHIENNEWLAFGSGQFVLAYTAADSRIVNAHISTGSVVSGLYRARVALPEDFDSFPTDAISVDCRRNGATDGLHFALWREGANDASGWVDIKPTAANVYQTKTYTPTSSYAAGDVVVLTIESNLPAAALRRHDIDGIKVKYNAK